MTDNPIKLVVVIASVRDGRLGLTVADWFVNQVRLRADLVVDVIDLLDHPLPLVMPASGQHPVTDVGRARDVLSARLSVADAFVVVTPEYNHSFPAALKNTLDWFLDEWAAKPVGFVSYGGMAGGLRAVEHLRQVLAELHTVTVRESVSFHDAWMQFDEDGCPYRPEECAAAANSMLDQVKWWAEALRDARTRRPYRR